MAFPPTEWQGIRSLETSRDGSRIAVTTGQLNLAKILEVPSGKVLTTIGPFRGNLQDVALSPDGRFAATACGSTPDTSLNLVEYWDLRQTDRPLRTFTGISAGYRRVVFDPTGRRIIAGGAGGDLRTWDVETGKGLDVKQAHIGQITELRLSPDGRTVATASATDRSIRLWDLETGRQQAVYADAAQQFIPSLDFSRDGSKLLSGDFYGGQARLWDVAGGEVLHVLPPKTGHQVAFRQDGRQFATIAGFATGIGGVLKLWDTETLVRGAEFPVAPGDPAPLVTYAPDGRHVLLGNGNGTIYVLRLAPPPVPVP